MASPTPLSTPVPTETLTPAPTSAPTSSPTPAPTDTATPAPSSTLTSTPTPAPTDTAEPAPSSTLTSTPTPAPTDMPTPSSSRQPTRPLSEAPTSSPEPNPSEYPSSLAAVPTAAPILEPPTRTPTEYQSEEPSVPQQSFPDNSAESTAAPGMLYVILSGSVESVNLTSMRESIASTIGIPFSDILELDVLSGSFVLKVKLRRADVTNRIVRDFKSTGNPRSLDGHAVLGLTNEFTPELLQSRETPTPSSQSELTAAPSAAGSITAAPSAAGSITIEFDANIEDTSLLSLCMHVKCSSPRIWVSNRRILLLKSRPGVWLWFFLS